MPTLQVRDLPDDVYNQLSYLAEKEHRSLAQETIVLLKEGLEARVGNKEKRRKALEKIEKISINADPLPDPVAIVREGRSR